ncbi:MAG: prepilin-type N-terminal cleavage/methylation domain-containing protein [Desulfobacterales bacterium]|nr:prepilin-type N-terminal cleavage/methylation domain-containing protein [Desulfobacterales bacterium]
MKILKYKFKDNNRGFTMIEVIIVLILIGIISAVAYQSVPQETMMQGTEFDKLVSHIRYTQNLSMARSERWSIRIGANSYSVRNPANVNVPLPGEQGATINLQALTITNAMTIFFDIKGRPVNAANVLLTDRVINTNYGKTITVVGYTGLVTTN